MNDIVFSLIHSSDPTLFAFYLPGSQVKQYEVQDHVRVQLEVLSDVKSKPWSMYRKLKLLRLSKTGVERHAGRLSRGSAWKEELGKRWTRFKRFVKNVIYALQPWEERIKLIESRFGSVVASYFVLCRWLFFLNIGMAVMYGILLMAPEVVLNRLFEYERGKWLTTALRLRKDDGRELKFVDLTSFSGALM